MEFSIVITWTTIWECICGLPWGNQVQSHGCSCIMMTSSQVAPCPTWTYFILHDFWHDDTFGLKIKKKKSKKTSFMSCLCMPCLHYKRVKCHMVLCNSRGMSAWFSCTSQNGGRSTHLMAARANEDRMSSARAYTYSLEWSVRRKFVLNRKLPSNLIQITFLSPTWSTSINARIKAYIWPFSLNSSVPTPHPKI